MRFLLFSKANKYPKSKKVKKPSSMFFILAFNLQTGNKILDFYLRMKD